MSLFAEEFLAILTVVNRSDVAHNPYRFLDCCRCLLCRGFVFYERRFFSAVFLHHTNPVMSGKEKSAKQWKINVFDRARGEICQIAFLMVNIVENKTSRQQCVKDSLTRQSSIVGISNKILAPLTLICSTSGSR